MRHPGWNNGAVAGSQLDNLVPDEKRPTTGYETGDLGLVVEVGRQGAQFCVNAAPTSITSRPDCLQYAQRDAAASGA